MKTINGKALRDILLGTGFLLLAALLFLLLSHGEKGGYAEVLCRGETVCVLPLGLDTEREILPGFTVAVENGSVCVKFSDCSGQDCVRHRPISRKGESIVCLPRNIIIRIPGEPETDFVI